MVLRRQAVHRRKQLEAGPFAADVASFALHLAAENKAAGTVRTYAEAALWFAAEHLLRETGKTSWHQVSAQDVQRWTVRLLGLYSDACARNQFRALQQFFRWLAAEDGIGDPMARLRPPKEAPKPVPCFTSVELSRLGKACRGSSFDERRDAAIVAVFLATGHPARRAGRDPLPPGGPLRQRRRPRRPRGHSAGQGRQAADGEAVS
jgi:site-specific recombinase XerD